MNVGRSNVALRACTKIVVPRPKQARTNVNCKNTRYGIDTDAKFQTLTTRKGIKEIISLSSSYFDFLDPTGRRDETQRLLRPKFLQMIVVLLSLLSDADLNDIKEFLESNYNLKADRPHLELLFLKVMPLASINSKVFLNGVITATNGCPLGEDSIVEGAHCWGRFIQRILVQGYLLPATVTDLSREEFSWIANWPEEEFKSSTVFNHLQYAGSRLTAINGIPPIEAHPGTSQDEFTITIEMLKNEMMYNVTESDLGKVTMLVPGNFPLETCRQTDRRVNFEIRDFPIDSKLFEAFKSVNKLIQRYNNALTYSKGKMGSEFFTASELESLRLKEFGQ